MHGPRKVLEPLSFLLMVAVFVFFKRNPDVFGRSPDGMPTLGDLLKLFCQASPVLLFACSIWIPSRSSFLGKGAKTLGGLGAALLLTGLIDDPRTSFLQNRALSEFRQRERAYRDVEDFCAGSEATFTFTKTSLRTLPSEEIEIQCGGKTRVYLIEQRRFIETSECDKNRLYNGLLRRIGSRRRGDCLAR